MINKHRWDGLGYTAVMEALVLPQKSYQCPGVQQWGDFHPPTEPMLISCSQVSKYAKVAP